MLKIFIGPNGYGKTYELERIKKSFLFIISAPFILKKRGNHPTIKCSYKHYIKRLYAHQQ